MTLKPNTTYYYRVKAVNAQQESEFSNVIAVTTLPDNTSNITPLPANPPTVSRIIPYTNRAEIYLHLFDPNTHIQEVKLTLSTNSDLSAPLYHNLTYILNKNTNYALDNGVVYLVLTVGNLTANTVYYGSVRSSNRISLSNATLFNFTTEKSLKPPVAIGVTNLTAITARANWDTVEGATNYYLDVSTNSGFSSLVVNNQNTGTTNYYDIPTLIENTTYYYRVRASNGSVTSKNSNIITFRTLDGVDTYPNLAFSIATPTIKQIRNININEAEVEWSKVSRATGYTLDVSTSPGFSTFVYQNITTTKTRYVIENLGEATLYYFRVRANHPSGNSAYVTTAFTTLTRNNTLNPPQILSPTTLFSRSLVINWVKRNYATRYYIQLSGVNTFSSILRSIYVGDIDSYVFDNLTPNTTYYVRLYALNTVDASAASNILTSTTNSSLPAITAGTPTEITDSTVRLNWSVNSVYTQYKLTIYKKFEAGNYLGNGFYFDRDIGNVSNLFIDVFLEPGTTYCYVITGVTSVGDTNRSIVNEFTTKNTAPTVQFSNNGQFVEWAGDLNRLEVATDKDFKFLVQGYPRAVNNDNKKYDVLYLMNQPTNYYFRGYYDNSGVIGLKSNTISSYGDRPILLPPVVTKTSALIRWKKNSSTQYRIQVRYLNAGNYDPITGHTFPIHVGDVSEYLIVGLTSHLSHSVAIQYFDDRNNTFSTLSLPVYFHTNRYDSSSDLAESTSLTAVTVSLTDASFDRFRIDIGGGVYDRYIISVSTRSDFLTEFRYIELTTHTTWITECEPNTTYYVRVWGVAHPSRTVVASSSILTSSLPAYSPAITTAPTISNFSVLNESEIIVNWTAVTNASGYVIEVSKTIGFTLLDTSINTVFLDSTKALVTNLSGTEVYYIRLYAYNNGSISPYSNTITVDTTP